MRLNEFIVVSVIGIASAGALAHEPEPTLTQEDLPKGFTLAECKLVKPEEAIKQESGGLSVTAGKRGKKVSCKHVTSQVTYVHTATCKTRSGKELPLADCCLHPDATRIPNCTTKPQPVTTPEESSSQQSPPAAAEPPSQPQP